jgi:hypothetical protein
MLRRGSEIRRGLIYSEYQIHGLQAVIASLAILYISITSKYSLAHATAIIAQAFKIGFRCVGNACPRAWQRAGSEPDSIDLKKLRWKSASFS